MRYYFDMLDSSDLTADEVGLNFVDDNAAIAEGLRSLGDWASDSTRDFGSRSVMVCIRNRSREVARLRLRLEIEITPPPVGTL
jgi:hypothetical protein